MRRRNTGSSSKTVQSPTQPTDKWTPHINLLIRCPLWPVPSTNLMRCNYFLWGSVKDNVYKHLVMKFKFKKLSGIKHWQFPDKNFKIWSPGIKHVWKLKSFPLPFLKCSKLYYILQVVNAHSMCGLWEQTIIFSVLWSCPKTSAV